MGSQTQEDLEATVDGREALAALMVRATPQCTHKNACLRDTRLRDTRLRNCRPRNCRPRARESGQLRRMTRWRMGKFEMI